MKTLDFYFSVSHYEKSYSQYEIPYSGIYSVGFFEHRPFLRGENKRAIRSSQKLPKRIRQNSGFLLSLERTKRLNVSKHL
jgi:hypothetical protein